MKMVFAKEENRLIFRYDSEIVWIEPWGENSLRVRATNEGVMPDNLWALLPHDGLGCDIVISDDKSTISNGNIIAKVTSGGEITFYNNKGEVLLTEFISRDAWGLKKRGREFTPRISGDYKICARFESVAEEKIYGMGQYQQPFLNIKGCTLELAHRNSQASVPFALSNLGYGFLWNNPAIGEAVFGKNVTEWRAESSNIIDYWITAGDTPADILAQYGKVTGTPPMMPDYAMGFWQCKLRYRTQEELLEVAREYKKRDLPLDVIVADFFHWPHQGDWKFDSKYWPDVKGMVTELNEMGIELMVSVWPTVEKSSENYDEMLSEGMLVRTHRGTRATMQFLEDTLFFDATYDKAREFIWSKVKRNYYDNGVKIFWLDEAEPEFHDYLYDNYRYHEGSCLEIGNVYPSLYSKAFYDGLKKEGQSEIINLVRCAWAGSQRYGALVWSGDIASTFNSFRNQIAAGLSMAMSGIPWWTSDIGGFSGGDPNDPEFRELICRWLQFGAFCPVFRLHGDRKPYLPPPEGENTFGTGAGNEVWSFGDEVYDIFRKYMSLRERLKPYIKEQMKLTHEKNVPIMRPLLYDFPEDENVWEINDQYMFGPDILVCPVTHYNDKSRYVYLPKGTKWKEYETGRVSVGGVTIECDAPPSVIPLFTREGFDL